MDGSGLRWLAVALELAVALRAADGDDDVSAALPPVQSESAGIDAPHQEQQPRTRRDARKRKRQQKQSRATSTDKLKEDL